MSPYQFPLSLHKSSPDSRRRTKSPKGKRNAAWRPAFESLETRALMTFLTPSTVPVGTNPAGIAVGDYNSDGKADMAVVDQTTSSVNLMVSNGDGTFQNNGTFAAGSGAIDAAFG